MLCPRYGPQVSTPARFGRYPMRIVVFSDSHNNFAGMLAVVDARPDGDLFIHLGDGEREFADLQALYPQKRMLGVAGNCDWGSVGKLVDTALCGGVKVFFTHGHTFGVKGGLENLLRAARTMGAEVALFGHTHVAVTGYDNGLHYMNPGSLSRPLRGSPTYGIVDITAGGIVTHIVEVDRGMSK